MSDPYRPTGNRRRRGPINAAARALRRPDGRFRQRVMTNARRYRRHPRHRQGPDSPSQLTRDR